MAEVGKATGEKTQAGREVYETPDGEMVSEKSTTFKYKGEWINIPTIHNGYSYDDDVLRMMLDAKIIEPTSTHKNKKDAIKAAVERSKSLKFDGGGLATQTEEAFTNPSDRLMAQSDERKLGAGLTSLEFEADMMPLLKKDPIAMLGYKASMPNRRFPSIQKLTGNNTPLYYDVSESPIGPNYNPSSDKVGYGRDYGSSKDVILHELRHRGLKILDERYKEKDSFIADYGDMAHRLLDKAETSGTKSNEFVVELYDNPDATYIKPGDSGSKNTIGYVADTLQFVDPNSDTQVMPDVADELLGIALSSEDHDEYRSLVGRDSPSKEEIEVGKSGLNKAAIDLLNEIDVLGFDEGGLAQQTEEALGWTAEGKKFANANPVEVKENQQSTALSIADVPVFDRPMDASESDKWTGVQDELGNRQYKTIFGRTYFVRPAEDQRSNYEKIQQDIVPAVKNYLDNPTAPSREQTIDFLKQSLGAAWETFKIPGDLAAGNKGMEDVTLGNIFELAGGTGAASTVGKVPGGDSSNTMRIFGGVSMQDTGTSKAFKKAKKLLKNLRSKDYSPFPSETGPIDFNTNKNIWEQTNWYVDPNDGQWRFYIDDSKSELKPFKEVFKIDPKAGLTFKELSEVSMPRENSKNVLLKDFFDHTDLYEKYPELKELNVGFYSNPGSRTLGAADYKNNIIYFNLAGYENYEDLKSVVLHEIQHIVQEKEGFVPGSNERSIPSELVKKQETEIGTKTKPIMDTVTKLEREEKAIKGRIAEELEDAKKPIPGLTAKQEQEIFKIKPYVNIANGGSDDGPSWASLGRKYGVPTRAVQKAWGRVNILNYLRGREKELNLQLTRANSDLFTAAQEMSNIEFEFYKGAGGEIESRLVQAMDAGEKGLANDGFPVSARNAMLQKEGNKFQYRGKEGVDPLVYTNQPRREPDQKSFLDRLKSKAGFAQGGVVNDMNRQMNLFSRGGLGDDGMQRDPVSGNEIPPGSLAEEVRDDIPAQLSEGEYVVPADVVRFFGVKYFEDLRVEAKMGLQSMEADGRIGGEPVGMPMAQASNPNEITEEDLAQLEQMLSTGVANGGLMDKIAIAAKTDKVINDRMNANGMVVGYATGGEVTAPTASYADPTRVDAVINKVMVTLQQKPELIQELSKRGIQISRTNPSMQAGQMNQANPPAETRKAFAIGGMPMDTSYMTPTGLPSWTSVPGSSYTYQGPGVPDATGQIPGTATPDTTPAAATNAADACKAMGMGYDPATGTCILVDSGDSGPTTAPEPAEFKWEEPDVNYFEMSEEELAAIGTGAKIDPLMNKLALGAAAVAGPLGLLIGGYNTYQQGKAISEVRSAALVAKARGFDDLAATLTKQADDLVGKSSFLVQGANTFGGLSGVNDFAQQIASNSKDVNLRLDPKDFGGLESPEYKRIIESMKIRLADTTSGGLNKLTPEMIKNQKTEEELNKKEKGGVIN